jgi:glycosyltransferase involved in cell wall biosynthesis
MKKSILICGPISSRSGYGNHARDIFKALYKLNKYAIQIMDVPWGNCPRNALQEKDEAGLNDIMTKSIVKPGANGQIQLDSQPDFYFDVRIPNEFQKVGKVNIGVTAGVETTNVSAAFLEGCNRMDSVIVVSEHSKSGFVNSHYDKMQQMPNGQQQKVGQLKLEKPIEVLFEGLEEDKFFSKKSSELSEGVKNTLDKIKENFCYLMVGQWCKGNFGEDRKDIPRAIKTFLETFANRPSPPALVVKTSGATQSILDREDCINKLKQIKAAFPSDVDLPNIYLLHGNLTDDEMNDLYNHPKVKCFYLMSHGEGFGRPLLEASFTGLPIITSNWSGPVDFLNSEKSFLIGGELVTVPKSVVWKDIIEENSQWFVADEQQTSKALNYVYTNYNKVKNNATELMKENRDKFNFEKMTEKLNEILTNFEKDIPQQVSLQLPKLKKVKDNTEPPKLKLPKLKKVTA